MITVDYYDCLTIVDLGTQLVYWRGAESMSVVRRCVMFIRILHLASMDYGSVAVFTNNKLRALALSLHLKY